jgi:hypothetical protein
LRRIEAALAAKKLDATTQLSDATLEDVFVAVTRKAGGVAR